MTHRPNAITHTQEYTVLPGVVRHTIIIFSLFTTPNLCPPPDTKSWRRHCGGPKGQRAHCRWEKEILSLGPKTSPGQGAHMVFSTGVGAEFELRNCTWRCYADIATSLRNNIT